MPHKGVSKPRVAALVGPYLSGKTSLLESILFITGALGRKGTIKEGSTFGDASEQGRARQMSIEVNMANVDYLDDPWTILDCPGSVEFQQDSQHALMVADVAVVVVDPEPDRAIMVKPLLKFLDDRSIPHMIFINKVDHSGVSVSEVMERLQGVSARPLVLREIPIREGDEITGYVDLVSERAYKYQPGKASDLIRIPDSVAEREDEARQDMLEHVADFDDALLEKLLEEVAPPKDEVYGDLARELAEDQIVPVFFGAGEKDEGVRRLLKALRHETPDAAFTAQRLGIEMGKGLTAQVFKTIHGAHTGKLSVARIWAGEAGDGMDVGAGKVSGLYSLHGQETKKIAKAETGTIAALGRLETVSTGELIGDGAKGTATDWPPALPPLFAMAVEPEKTGDDVKLTGALAKLCEEDVSLSFEQNPDTQELLLWGQGDIHLQVALDRLRSSHNVEARGRRPQVPYKETIRKSVTQQGRHKRQTGGHGQFGDVHLLIRPLGRGDGFAFSESIVGGAVPRNYIPSVEKGVREYLSRGPLGFPVVDLAVELTDGSFHAVDSSDQAFMTAAQIAMREGIPKCDPILLEPIVRVEVSTPSQATSKAQRTLSTRRGQILGFDQKPGWEGWDVVQANIPQSEMHDLIIELRSMTMGVGTFSWQFDHLQELTGRHAEQVVEKHKERKGH